MQMNTLPCTQTVPDERLDAALPAGQGLQRDVWNSRFGPIVIEVIGGRSYVNGKWVEPAEAALLLPNAGS